MPLSARPVRLAALVLLAAATAAGAQTHHDSDAPLQVGAAHIELQDKAHRVVLTGNVSVRQAEMTLNAQRILVSYTGQVVDGAPQASRLDASGGVTVTRPDQTARGRYGVYDLNRRVITMLGGVSLTQGNNTVNGGRLTINLDSGRAVIDGAAVGGGESAPGITNQGGRVTGIFSVPKRN